MSLFSFFFSPNTHIYIIPETLFLFLEYLSFPRLLSGLLFILSWWCKHSNPASHVLSHFCSTVSSIALLNPNFVKSYAFLWKLGSALSFWIVYFLVSPSWFEQFFHPKAKSLRLIFTQMKTLYSFIMNYYVALLLQRCTHLLIMHFKNLIAFNGAKQNT